MSREVPWKICFRVLLEFGRVRRDGCGGFSGLWKSYFQSLPGLFTLLFTQPMKPIRLLALAIALVGFAVT